MAKETIKVKTAQRAKSRSGSVYSSQERVMTQDDEENDYGIVNDQDALQ